MLKRRSGGQELGEFVRTPRNTYANAGSVAQFDFHQSDTSKFSFPLLSFLFSNDLMESDIRKGLLLHDLVFGEQQVNQLPTLNAISDSLIDC